jgi:Ni/Fe-hydrogenase subunit HybB-like protein
VSLLFWYLGLIPDLASARDRAPTLLKARLYGLFALGWRGAARDWRRFQMAYGLLAGLATPLVISVHSIVSMDFAISNLTGWHSTIFPPYFVVGAIHSGLALVLMLIIPIRWLLRWQDLITDRHLDALGKMLLFAGSLMGYAYLMETFTAWYSGHRMDRYMYLLHRPFDWPWMYWAMILCNAVVPHLYWSRRLRTSGIALFLGSAVILVGMWIERFVLIVSSLDADFLPSSWHGYAPTWVDVSILLGSLSAFLFLFLLATKYVPVIPIHEVKEVRYEEEKGLWSKP